MSLFRQVGPAFLAGADRGDSRVRRRIERWADDRASFYVTDTAHPLITRFDSPHYGSAGSINFSGYGAAVTITAPPAIEVITSSQLAGLGLSRDHCDPIKLGRRLPQAYGLDTGRDASYLADVRGLTKSLASAWRDIRVEDALQVNLPSPGASRRTCVEWREYKPFARKEQPTAPPHAPLQMIRRILSRKLLIRSWCKFGDPGGTRLVVSRAG